LTLIFLFAQKEEASKEKLKKRPLKIMKHKIQQNVATFALFHYYQRSLQTLKLLILK
jgi:hypothetical protein